MKEIRNYMQRIIAIVVNVCPRAQNNNVTLALEKYKGAGVSNLVILKSASPRHRFLLHDTYLNISY